MKPIVSTFLLLTMILVTSRVHAGACAPASEAGNTRTIDGPANVRELPQTRHKVIASLPNGAQVKILTYNEFGPRDGVGKYELWYKISWQDETGTHEGWTAEQNIVCD